MPILLFYDGPLYSAVAAGHASLKINPAPIVINAGHSKSVVSLGNMNRVICSEKPKADHVNRKNVAKVGSEKLKNCLTLTNRG